MLRVDVKHRCHPLPHTRWQSFYAGNADTLGEIWAIGLRNPEIFFDKNQRPLDCRCRSAKMGRGQLYTLWPGRQIQFWLALLWGFWKYDYSQCNDKTVFIPIHVYANNSGGEGCSVTGGYVYRGEEIPYLEGHYIYGDFAVEKCGGWKRWMQQCARNELIYTVGPMN